jgi:hypothetical protein
VTGDKPGSPLYDEYYRKHGNTRNDLLANPEVMFQTFAVDRANISALQKLNLDRRGYSVYSRAGNYRPRETLIPNYGTAV